MTANPVRWTSLLRDRYGRPPYRPDAVDGFDAPVLEGYRAAMRELATELEIPLLDLPGVWADHLAASGGEVEDLLLDGMHPNDAGHAATAEALLPVVRGVFR